MNINHNLFIIVRCIFLGCIFSMVSISNAKATSDRLPQVMVGQSSITTLDAYGNIDMTIYGSASGNYAVYNVGDNLLSYDHSTTDLNIGVLKCYDYIPSDPITRLSFPCFIHNYAIANQSRASQSMLSTTYVDGVAEYQIPAIYLYSRSVIGDAVMPDYSNFAFWGKNLAQRPVGSIETAAGAAWALSDYSINDKSQSAWVADDQGEYVKFDEKIQTLAKSGTVIDHTKLEPVGASATLYLQTLNSDIILTSGSTAAQNAKYPEGRVWVIKGNVAIPAGKTITYRGVGTVIIVGNLVVGDGAKIVPNDEKVDKLGIIVLGN